MSNEKEIFVIGHKNPDTDSICSAIAYAYFKNQISKSNCYKAKRAGGSELRDTVCSGQIWCEGTGIMWIMSEIRSRTVD